MVSVFDGTRYILRLDKGERLSEAIQAFLSTQNITSAWIDVLGGATEVELGFYALDTKAYRWQRYAKTLEITGLHGNIALDQGNKPVLHLHGTFADEAYQVIGGHVRELVVGGTCEILLQALGTQLHRAHDDQVGLNTLDI